MAGLIVQAAKRTRTLLWLADTKTEAETRQETRFLEQKKLG